nr:MAG TPA: hypothetical protein [Caudoviricetes sp.]
MGDYKYTCFDNSLSYTVKDYIPTKRNTSSPTDCDRSGEREFL